MSCPAPQSWRYCLVLLILGLLQACHPVHPPPRHDVIAPTLDLDQAIGNNIGQLLDFAPTGGIRIDAQNLYRPASIRALYQSEADHPIWSAKGQLLAPADSLYRLIQGSFQDGLDPRKFYDSTLGNLLDQSSLGHPGHRDAAVWARTDLLLTSAFFKLVSQLHYGSLPTDSLRLRKDMAYSDTSLDQFLTQAIKGNEVEAILDSVQPTYTQYILLKAALADYEHRNGSRTWDSLPEANPDSAGLMELVAHRLLQGGEIDSAQLRDKKQVILALKAFQRAHDLFVDGKPGKRTIAALNVPASARILQISLNLDRWRQMPDTLPSPHMLVNIPSFLMQIRDHDTLLLESRVIVGAPSTPTPELSSAITNFQLFPYWRVPLSIIAKEVLPGYQKDKQYLTEHNLEIVDHHGNLVDPTKLKWKRFNKNYFPYLLRQMTGLDNSLGIIKFNFRNKYAVYMHDTNERWLFGTDFRARSHGCVRVQKWDSLSRYLVRYDTIRHVPDSLAVWEQENLQKQVNFRPSLPIYIRYFTCRVNDAGKLVLDADVYGYDSIQERQMAEAGTRDP